MKKLVLTAFALLCCAAGFAQNEFYNDGAQVYVQTGGLIYVQGEVINDDQGANIGQMFNSGDIQLTGNWTNTSTSNVFQALDPGTTTFLGTGAVQTIGGTTDTYFNNLTLNKPAATLEVRQLRNSLCDGVLNLTNDFLNTQTFTFLVANPDPSAIQRTGPIVPNYMPSTTEGYVTSTVGSAGRLARATSILFPGATYFYPVGTSARFRPVEITPTSVGNNVYSVQFVDIPTFSTGLKAATLATINPAWYHFIERQVAAGSPENIRIYHDFVADNVCDITNVTMAEWNLALWDDLSPTASLNPAPFMSWTQKTGYPGAYPTPWVSNAFALAGLYIGTSFSCVFPENTFIVNARAGSSTINVNQDIHANIAGGMVQLKRSTDGFTYETINNYAMMPGVETYSFEDINVVPGVVYKYQFTVTDAYGASYTSNISEAVIGLDKDLVTLGLYPVPTLGELTWKINVASQGDYFVTIHDVLGHVVYRETTALQSGVNALPFEVAGLPAGAYTIQLNGGNGLHLIEKFVKE